MNLASVVPFNLADIGEGITECEVVQWYGLVGFYLKLLYIMVGRVVDYQWFSLSCTWIESGG